MPAAERGFTLIELVVALTLLALLTTALTAALRIETERLDRRSDRLERSAELAAACAFLRELIAEARPIAPMDRVERAIVFDGHDDHLEFLAPAPATAAPGGLYLFSVERVDGRLQLRSRLFDGVLRAADGAPTLLVDGVREAHFAYLGADWTTDWVDRPRLPLLVRLDIALADGEPAPALLAAPRLAAPRFAVTGR